MNNDLMFSSKSDDWATPQDLFDKLHVKYRFNIDLAASKENAKCEMYFTEEDNALVQSWKGVRGFCNPPYSRRLQKKFIQKAYEETLDNPTDTFVVMLLPARTDTRAFWDYIYQKEHTRIEFIKGRLRFGGSKNAAPFPSMLVYFNWWLADMNSKCQWAMNKQLASMLDNMKPCPPEFMEVINKNFWELLM